MVEGVSLRGKLRSPLIGALMANLKERNINVGLFQAFR
jgi:hypothetical protein